MRQSELFNVLSIISALIKLCFTEANIESKKKKARVNKGQYISYHFIRHNHTQTFDYKLIKYTRQKVSNNCIILTSEHIISDNNIYMLFNIKENALAHYEQVHSNSLNNKTDQIIVLFRRFHLLDILVRSNSG